MPFNKTNSSWGLGNVRTGAFAASDERIKEVMKRYLLGINPNPDALPMITDVGMTRGGLVPGGAMDRAAAWAARQQQRGSFPVPRYFGSPAFANDPAPNTTVVPKTTAAFPGMLSLGNIDLNRRPVVKNGKGVSTVLSTSFNIDGKEVLVPMVSDDGMLLDKKGAMSHYMKTGKHLGIFDSPASANAYAKKLHLDQEKQYAPPSLPKRNPKRGKTATLDLSDPIIVDAASDPKALVQAIGSAGDKPVLVRNAMAIGMGSDNVVVAGNKTKTDPKKVARSVQTPVVSKQGFVDVLSYIRGR